MVDNIVASFGSNIINVVDIEISAASKYTKKLEREAGFSVSKQSQRILVDHLEYSDPKLHNI